jgi:hypothetical protein
MSWRRLAEVLAGLAIGGFCLVAWSATSSAAEVDPPPTPLPPGTVADVTGSSLAPVQQLLEPVVPGLTSLVDGVVTPTVGAVSTPPSSTPPVPGLPSGPMLPGPGQPQLPALPLPGSGASALLDPVDASSVPPAPGVAENAAPASAGRSSDVTSGRSDRGSTSAIDSLTATPAGDGSSVPQPFELPALPALVLGVGGAAISSVSGAGSVGLALLAVLAGVVAVAATSVWRRLAHAGLLAPPAMSYAIATPPG